MRIAVAEKCFPHPIQHLINATGVVCFALVFALTNVATTWRIGLISDDFPILAQSVMNRAGIFDVVHWSPLLQMEFEAISRGLLTPQGGHILSSLLHVLVAIGCAKFLIDPLGVPTWVAWWGAMLCLTTPVASESVWWLCAQGYIWTALALIAALCVAAGERRGGFKSALLLGLLQLAACLAWDWSVVVLPAVLLVRCVRPGAAVRPLDFVRLQADLLPMAVIWCAHQLLRFSLYIPLGSGWLPFGLTRAAKDLFLMPAMLFIPDAAPQVRAMTAAALWALMGVASVRSVRDRALLAVILLLQTPYLFQGVLQARYLYLSAPLIYAMLLSALYPRRNVGARRVAFFIACLGLLSYQGWMYGQNAREWRNASAQALMLASELKTAIAQGPQPVLLVNVPEFYGDPDVRWRPFMWRRGLQTQLPPFDDVRTNDFIERERLSTDQRAVSWPQVVALNRNQRVLQIVRRPHQPGRSEYAVVGVD